MTDKEKQEAERKRKQQASDALRMLGSGLARTAGMTLSGRKKQLDDQIEKAGG